MYVANIVKNIILFYHWNLLFYSVQTKKGKEDFESSF